MDNQENKLENEQTKSFKDILADENLKNFQDSEQPMHETSKASKKDFPFLYLGKFFLSMTILNFMFIIIVSIIQFDLYEDITNYTEIIKRRDIIQYTTRVLFLLAVLIPYIIIRLQMKRHNKNGGIYWLDIFAFSLICINFVDILKFIDVYSYFVNSSNSIFCIILTSLFIFIIGRYIQNKLLCGVAICYVGLIFLIICILYLNSEPIEYYAHTIMHHLDYYKNNINLIVVFKTIPFYSLAGQLFLGIYLLIKDKKKNQNY